MSKPRNKNETFMRRKEGKMLRLMMIKSERFNGAIERFINLQERDRGRKRKENPWEDFSVRFT